MAGCLPAICGLASVLLGLLVCLGCLVRAAGESRAARRETPAPARLREVEALVLSKQRRLARKQELVAELKAGMRGAQAREAWSGLSAIAAALPRIERRLRARVHTPAP